MSFSSQLKKYRKAAGYTQRQVANLLGIDSSTYCGYETGKRQPDVERVKRIARILNTTGDELLETGFTVPTQDETEAAWQIRERLRRDPDYRLLFDAADKATPEHLRAAAAMLKALEPQEDQTDGC